MGSNRPVGGCPTRAGPPEPAVRLGTPTAALPSRTQAPQRLPAPLTPSCASGHPETDAWG